MFEIEKKFLLSPAQEKKIKKGAKFLGAKVFTDTYFDRGAFELTQNDIWLRTRGKNAELKMPLEGEKENNSIYCNRYEEFCTEQEIRQILNIRKGSSFLDDLHTDGYRPFVSLATHRQTYQRDRFHIDIDAVDFGYELVEVEMMVESEKDARNAEKEIERFSRNMGLELKPVRGKVIEYLFRKNPEHYKVLKEAGVVIE